MVLGNSKGRGKIVVLFSIYKTLHNIYEDYSGDNKMIRVTVMAMEMIILRAKKMCADDIHIIQICKYN